MYHFNPDDGFETFTVAIYDQITQEGRDAFYVFDCLSELQSVWYTDLMMGNFFRVTCPYLFELDTVAYFPLLRGRHSFDAVARIRDTTQLLLDVYSGDTEIYLHPLKVWNRYSSRMFLPHCCSRLTSSFRTVEDGVSMSRYYQTIQKLSAGSPDQNYDSHDRFLPMQSWITPGIFFRRNRGSDHRQHHDERRRLKALVKHYFTPVDYFMLRDRMIGSGAIGGKACGMLLARKISEKEIPEYLSLSEPHDSFYIGSDVFYTYIVSNGCWRLRIRQRTKEEYFSAAEELRKHLYTGEFPAKIREQFLNVIEYFGQSPFIVRSSSFLEDGFGNAFAGKYESVFCVNQEVLRNGWKNLSSSTESLCKHNGLLRPGIPSSPGSGKEGRTDGGSGAACLRLLSGTVFHACAAGVGYSHSAYKWYPDMDPAAGMLRIVMGLGTKAVDRTKEDYPRLANLDRPSVTVLTTVEQKHKFSQRNIDVLDCRENRLKEVPLDTLLPVLPLWYKKMVLEHDHEAEYRLRQMGRNQDVWFVSCQKLLENQKFTSLMQKILKTLERVYENPVDIEYTVNIDESGDFVVNLLQCRPLYLGEAGEKTDIGNLRLKETFFDIRDSSMGPSGKRKIDIVVQIDPYCIISIPTVRNTRRRKLLERSTGITGARGSVFF